MTLDEIREFFTQNTGNLTYVYYFALLVGCSLGLPCNADLVMVLAGALASIGILKLPFLIVLAWTAILVGDTVMFSVGRRYGDRILSHGLIRKLFSEEKQLRVRSFLHQNAKKFLFLIRFTPGLRAVSFLTSGSMQIETKTFLKMNILSTTLYIPTLITVSYFTSVQMQTWVSGYQTFAKWFASLVLLFILYSITKRIICHYIVNRVNKTTENPHA
jgi:membrane protein DedA with SNARE-associated domain